jgi:hypothetical protein
MWRPKWSKRYFIEDGGDFEYFCNGLGVGLVKFLGVEFDAGFDCEVADDGSHELHSIFLLVDVIGDVTLRIVLLG